MRREITWLDPLISRSLASLDEAVRQRVITGLSQMVAAYIHSAWPVFSLVNYIFDRGPAARTHVTFE
jgi:hypothetical protein